MTMYNQSSSSTKSINGDLPGGELGVVPPWSSSSAVRGGVSLPLAWDAA